MPEKCNLNYTKAETWNLEGLLQRRGVVYLQLSLCL